MDRRRFEEFVARSLMVVSALVILSVLAFIVVEIAAKGLPALSLSMLTQTPKGGYYLGKEGGIANAILGSLALAGGATILSLLVSVPLVLFINVYAVKRRRIVTLVRFSLDLLWGIPSIVYGAFGFAVMVALGMTASLLAGILVVAVLILPIMSRAMDEVVRGISRELAEASFALGATRLETSLHVIARQALPGFATAVLIAFGRGMGDAASVLFTAGFTDSLPTSLFRPVATLPLAIFFQMGTPFPEVQDRAYAAAFILTVLVFLISIAARLCMKVLARHVVR